MAGSNQLAPGVHRLGTDKVNWYLVEQDGRVTVIDAGLPAYWDQLEPALAGIGASLEDVDALVLTHAHSDHIGVAKRLHEHGVPVYIHAADNEMLSTGKLPKREKGPLPYLRHGTAWAMLGHLVRNGGARPGRVTDAVAIEPGVPLDVPGRPVAIHTPGHSNGHCALHFEGRRVLFAGDLLCTWHPLTGRRGAQLMPGAFNVSSAQSLDSLARIEGLDVDLVLPGHGEPWTEGAAAAVAAARATGPT